MVYFHLIDLNYTLFQSASQAVLSAGAGNMGRGKPLVRWHVIV